MLIPSFKTFHKKHMYCPGSCANLTVNVNCFYKETTPIYMKPVDNMLCAVMRTGFRLNPTALGKKIVFIVKTVDI